MTQTLKILKYLFYLLSVAFAGTSVILSGGFLFLSPALPDVEALREIELQTPLRVYSNDGKLIGEFGEKRRIPVSIDDTPQPLIDALLAAEDDSFYQHSGVSISGIVRAVFELVATGEKQTGGSTITMQVARNFS